MGLESGGSSLTGFSRATHAWDRLSVTAGSLVPAVTAVTAVQAVVAKTRRARVARSAVTVQP
jgi:hypothetical protein